MVACSTVPLTLTVPPDAGTTPGEALAEVTRAGAGKLAAKDARADVPASTSAATDPTDTAATQTAPRATRRHITMKIWCRRRFPREKLGRDRFPQPPFVT